MTDRNRSAHLGTLKRVRQRDHQRRQHHESGIVTISGTTNLQAGSGSIVLTNASNDFGGAITGVATGGVNMVDANDMAFGSLNGGSAQVILTAAGDMFGPGFVTGGTGIFSSSGGADSQVAISEHVQRQ